MVLESEREILLPVMSLVFNVSYSLQHELGELAAEQDEQVLNRIVHTATQMNLWDDLLPVVAQLSPSSQAKVVNLPVLREDGVIDSILQAAQDQPELWRAVLPLLPMMTSSMLDTVALGACQLSLEARQRIAEAALMTETWTALANVIARMPNDQQKLTVTTVQTYLQADEQLINRLRTIGQEFGLEQHFIAA